MEETSTFIQIFVKKLVGNGIGISELETICILSSIIRFTILAFRYNMLTSFRITFISSFATYLWFRHLVDLGIAYEPMLIHIALVNRFGKDIGDLINATAKERENIVRWNNPLGILAVAISRASVSGEYLMDPISIMFSAMPEGQEGSLVAYVRGITDKIYYFIYSDVVPALIINGQKLYVMLSNTVAYSYVTRVNKKWCPYFIRWHWTMIMSYTILSFIPFGIVTRCYLYLQFVLSPAISNSDRSLPEIAELKMQFDSLFLFTKALILVHMSLVLYSLFHAMCGQYFYLPVFTRNTELHIGFKPNTKYSGGNSNWQKSPWQIRQNKKLNKNSKGTLNFLKNLLYKILGFFSSLFVYFIKFIKKLLG